MDYPVCSPNATNAGPHSTTPRKAAEGQLPLFCLLPWHHFLPFRVPLIDRSTAYIVVVVVFRATPHHSLSKCNVDPSPIAFAPFSFRNTMQPIGLRPASHQYHIP